MGCCRARFGWRGLKPPKLEHFGLKFVPRDLKGRRTWDLEGWHTFQLMEFQMVRREGQIWYGTSRGGTQTSRGSKTTWDLKAIENELRHTPLLSKIWGLGDRIFGGRIPSSWVKWACRVSVIMYFLHSKFYYFLCITGNLWHTATFDNHQLSPFPSSPSFILQSPSI